MADIITNLHPDGDKNTNLYPNIKKENIPSKSISTDKLDDNVISLIGSLKPSGTDTSANILAFTSNKGIYVATDNGHWYYWNGSAYADGGIFMAPEITDLFDYSNNLVDDSKIENGKFINWNNGDIASSGEYRLYNDYIEITGDIYITLFNDNNGIFLDDNYAILGAYYNQNKSYLGEIYISNSETRGAILNNNIYKLIPNGAKYFRFSVKDNGNYKWMVSSSITNYYEYGQIKNKYLNLGGKLQGKTVINFGDSIIGNTRDNTSVSSFISKKTGANVHNMGFGGCQMSKHEPNWDLCSMYNLANDIANNDFSNLVIATATGWNGMPSYFTNTAKLLSKINFSKVDAITISYGTNDYRDGDNLIGNNNVNIFDNDFDESGFINPSNGEDATSSSYKRTSKYYPIKLVSSLYLRLSTLRSSFVILFYDLNNNYLGYESHSSSSLTYTFTVPSKAVCFRIYTEASFNGIACISYEASEIAVPYFNNEYVIDCLKYSVRTIQKVYPNIKILVTTPIYRSFLNSNNEELTNSDIADFGGGTLEDYSKAYIDACKELKVPCLDLYHLSQLNNNTRNYYYPNDDGTHPNELGRESIAGLIAEELEKILN